MGQETQWFSVQIREFGQLGRANLPFSKFTL
jgi:hypothetical protein